MNSSSRSHCSFCQSWDNKGPCCVADPKGKRSLLPRIPWLPWGTLCDSSPATQAGNTAAGAHHFIRKKRGQFHLAEKSVPGLCETLRAQNTSASIPDSCLYHRQCRTMKNKTTGFSKCVHLTVQGIVPLSLKLQQHDVTSKQTLF